MDGAKETLMCTAAVIYESWFGNTRRIAERIAVGMRSVGIAADALAVGDAVGSRVHGVDLLVIGAPTHAHSLPTPASRKEAARWADDPRKQLRLEGDPEVSGLREWIAAAEPSHRAFVAFSTRADLMPALSGSAAHSIRRHLRKKGWTEFDGTESFVVPTAGAVDESELRHAEFWGRQLGSGLRAVPAGDLQPA